MTLKYNDLIPGSLGQNSSYHSQAQIRFYCCQAKPELVSFGTLQLPGSLVLFYMEWHMDCHVIIIL